MNLAAGGRHQVVMDNLGPRLAAAPAIQVMHRSQLANDATAQAGLFFDFAQGGGFNRFTGIELAFRKRPVIVLRAMYEQDARCLLVACIDDEAARRDDFIPRFHMSDSSTEKR